MNTFKSYITDTIIDKNTSKPMPSESVFNFNIDGKEYTFSGYFEDLNIYKKMIMDIKSGNNLDQRDINLFIKKYPKKNYFRILSLVCIKYDKKIPKIFLDYLEKNINFSYQVLISNIKGLSKEVQLKVLLKNPELVGEFI